MRQRVQTDSTPEFTGGLITLPSLLSVPPTASPNCLNVKFSVGGVIEKRLGSTTLNATVLVSSAATGFNPDSGATLGVGLSLVWPMNEQAGTRVDVFGSNNLVENNSVSFVAGILGNAAFFVAANTGYFTLADNAAIRGGSSNFTWTGWVYIDSMLQGRRVFEKGDNAVNLEYSLQIDPINRLNFYVADGSATVVGQVSSVAITTATWYEFACWQDVTLQTVNIQMNNGTVNSAALTGTAGVTTQQLNVGIAANFGAAQNWSGRLDQFTRHSKVLTAQERTDLYNSGNGNSYNASVSNAGWGAFDFGAGFAGGQPLRWLTVAAGTGIFASSNRGVSFVTIATDRGLDYQSFERSKAFLIATSDTGNKVLYWAGSVGTFMAALAPGSAPPAKHALDFAGFLLLMNHSGGNRIVAYADNTQVLTSAWTNTFEVASSLDDEITGGVVYNRGAYVFTRYTINRVSHVGGNPDFSVQPVKAWGAVPGTIKKATYLDYGEVIIALGWDRHVRIFDGSDDQIISTNIEEPNGQAAVYLKNIPEFYLGQCRAEVDSEEQVYRLFVVSSPSTQTTDALCLNLRTGAWYPYANQAFNAAVMAESSNSRILVGVNRTGRVHWLNTGNTDAGTAINEFYDSPLMFSASLQEASKLHKIGLYFSPTSSGIVQFQDRVALSTVFTPPRDQLVLQDTTNVLQVQKIIDVPVTSNVYQYRLSSSASTAQPWRLTRQELIRKDLGIGRAG